MQRVAPGDPTRAQHAVHVVHVAHEFSCILVAGQLAEPVRISFCSLTDRDLPVDRKTARSVIRDPDKIYGEDVQRRIQNMGIEQVLIAPRSPLQSPYVERLVGPTRAPLRPFFRPNGDDGQTSVQEVRLSTSMDGAGEGERLSQIHASLSAKDGPLNGDLRRPAIALPDLSGLLRAFTCMDPDHHVEVIDRVLVDEDVVEFRR